MFTPKLDFTAKQSNRRSEFDRSGTTCIKAVILIQLFFQKQCFLIPLGLKNAWYLILFLANDLCSCVSAKVKKKKLCWQGCWLCQIFVMGDLFIEIFGLGLLDTPLSSNFSQIFGL